MQKIYIILFFFVANTSFAQNFYDAKTVQNIEIKFAFNDWDMRMDTAATGAEGYTLALWCKINGQQFDSVGVKYKGHSSFKVNNKKNPLHIELNYIKNQDYQGFKSVKLSNVFADPTFTREQISYDILRKYADAPDCNQAKVTINSVFYGVMTNTESINKSFLDNHFGETNGVFVKGNPIAAPGGSPSLPSLVYLGKDTAAYYGGYELKSKTGWAKLVSLIDTLNNQPAQLEKHLDIDRTLWMLAFNNLFVNLDSYSGLFAQNYYLYQDKTKRFLPMIWDLNMCFGGFTQTGEAPQLKIADVPKLKLFLHENTPERPLIKQLFANPTYKKAYVAKLKTMAKENLSNGLYLKKVADIQLLIDSLVQKDNNKFFTYQQFSDNITKSASGAGAGGTAGVIIGLKPLIDERLAFLNTQAAFTAAAPKIDTVIEPKNILPNSKVFILAKVSNTTSVSLRYRFEKNAKFKNVAMFDDGKNNDGAANDGVFGASFTMQDVSTEYYVFAENANAASFSPERAEYEFYKAKVNTTSTSIKKNELLINEIVSSNVTIAKDEAGQYEDYIELKNNTNSTIDLSYAYLSDDASNLNKWKFKAGTTLKAGEYMIVWADQDETQGDLHSNFKLSASGEKIVLSNIDGSIIDSTSFPKMANDVSFARCSATATIATFKISKPTFKAANTCLPVGVEDMDSQSFMSVFPNPNNGFFTVLLKNEKSQSLQILNIYGQIIEEKPFEEKVEIDATNWQSGIYFVKNGNLMKKIVIQK